MISYEVLAQNTASIFKGNFHICSYTFCHKKNTIIPCQQGHFQHNKSDWQFVQPFSTKNIAHFTRLSGDLTPFFALPLNIKSHPPPRAVVFYSLCVSHFNVQGDDASKSRKLALKCTDWMYICTFEVIAWSKCSETPQRKKPEIMGIFHAVLRKLQMHCTWLESKKLYTQYTNVLLLLSE